MRSAELVAHDAVNILTALNDNGFLLLLHLDVDLDGDVGREERVGRVLTRGGGEEDVGRVPTTGGQGVTGGDHLVATGREEEGVGLVGRVVVTAVTAGAKEGIGHLVAGKGVGRVPTGEVAGGHPVAGEGNLVVGRVATGGEGVGRIVTNRSVRTVAAASGGDGDGHGGGQEEKETEKSGNTHDGCCCCSC